jgi:drug/metabolite transporter (DMT)-like permease
MSKAHGLLLLATLLAACGQILFKIGASGRSGWQEFLNLPIISGLICYGVGTLMWIFALSRLPLKTVFPYTALTFVLVYVAAFFLLDERLSIRSAAGVGCVLLGLFLLTTERL